MRLLIASVGLTVIALGCRHLDLRLPERQPSVIDAGLLSALRPRNAAWGLELEFVENTAYFDRFLFAFQTYCDIRGDYKRVAGDYYATRARDGAGSAPLLLVSPILAGPVDDYLASRFICQQVAKGGMSAFFLHQETVILDPRRDAILLEAWMRENVRDNLKALDALSLLPEVDASRLGSMGVSLGAIKNVVIVACEERLRGNVLTLAGADLAGILMTSKENLVTRYLEERRRRDGLEPEDVAREFRRWFLSEPARLAPAVASGRTLLFLGRFDDKVPHEKGMLLRSLLGDPETHVFPLGHYTGVLAAPWIVQVALGWLRERFESAPGE